MQLGCPLEQVEENIEENISPQKTGMESAHGGIQIMAYITRDDSCAVRWGGMGWGMRFVLGVGEDYLILLRFLRLNLLMMHHRAKAKIQESYLCFSNREQSAFIRIQDSFHLRSMLFKW